MIFNLDDMIETHNACVANLDETKCCETCKHDGDLPANACYDCYSSMLGFPVNPTNWEMK